MDIISMMRYLYTLNQSRGIRISWRNPFISNLYFKARETVSHASRFFLLLKRLHSFLQRRPIFLQRRHPYIKYLMDECLKELTTTVTTSDPGKKAALLIGINYQGTKSELNGCENDVELTKEVLVKHYGFKEENIRLLKGDQTTRENILKGIDWLVKKADEGFGSLWFQYSGHGYYFKDQNGDELDGMDECIVTCDNYAILDDEFRANLVNKLRGDTKLFCIMDCCHSGTMLDLRYKYNKRGNKSVLENNVKPTCNIIALSGCRDDQESADAKFDEGWAGALTKCLLNTLNKFSYKPKLFEMLSDIHNQLYEYNFGQVPQLTSSKDLNKDDVFHV